MLTRNPKKHDTMLSRPLLLSRPAYKMRRRIKMATITKQLRNYQIIYRWAYSAKLKITKDGKSFTFNSVENGIHF